jgi:hypothetical protein
MRNGKCLRTIFAVLLAGALSACGGSPTSSGGAGSSQPTGTIFVLGTDAPLPSVVSFQVLITGLALTNGSTSVSVLTAPQTVEFSRLNGLNALLDLNAVQAGTYTGAQLTLSSPVIGYLNVQAGQKPTLSTINGTLLQSTVNVTFPQPLIVNQNDVFGLKIDFRLKASLETSGGQIDGNVNPVIAIKAISPDAPDAVIDDFRAGVVSVNPSGGTFVVQGPHGRQFTVVTNNQTDFEDGMTLNDLDTNTIVEVSGSLDRVTLALVADEVQIVSKDHFVLGGLTTYVNPSTGPATSIDVLVRSELPDLSGVPLGQISTLNLNNTELYRIRYLHLPVTQLLFNNSSLVAGQHLTVGGPLNTTTNPPVPTVRRVVLNWQGQEGTWAVGSTNIQSGNNGNFTLNDDALAGVLFGGQVKVITSNFTRFTNLGGLSALSGTQAIPLRIVGLVLLDHSTGNPVIVAGRVEKLTN